MEPPPRWPASTPRGSVSAFTASILVLGLFLTVGVF
jgi:hypothetical protein